MLTNENKMTHCSSGVVAILCDVFPVMRPVQFIYLVGCYLISHFSETIIQNVSNISLLTHFGLHLS